MLRFLVGLISLSILSTAFADTIVLKDDNDTLTNCILLQESKESVTVLHESGLLNIPRAAVKSVKKDSKDLAVNKKVTSTRIFGEDKILLALAKRKWAADLRQIPATVIDKGILRNVPYKSYRAGEDYEINVYGDPDAPAGFEIGIYRGLLNDNKAKSNSIDFACDLLPESSDCKILKALNIEEDSVSRNGLTFEITPPTAEDSYGGWWVSVYNVNALESVRASDQELELLTVGQSATNEPEATPTITARIEQPTQPRTPNTSLDSLSSWSASDFKSARKPKTSSGSSGAKVYVKGYYRKNGTYVRPHTRSRRRN